MYRSTFKIKKMDCPSEERLIRLRLEGRSEVISLNFLLDERILTVLHSGSPSLILAHLHPLKLDAVIISSEESNNTLLSNSVERSERKILVVLLIINLLMFFIEGVVGFLSDSMGLISDGVDMLFDAVVYGLSLYAVGRSKMRKLSAAKASGILQLLFAVFIFGECLRRFFYGANPLADAIIGISLLALVANVTCLILIHRHRDNGIHMKASWIFSANDVIANLGVLIAGILVSLTGSRYPDLIIGMAVSCLILRGAISILGLSNEGSEQR